MSEETQAREEIADFGRMLYQRGLAHGSSGNLSARVPGGFLVTPTNTCLGRLDPARLSKLDLEGRVVSGDPPSKESLLHLALYRAREVSAGIVHLHCTHCVALSCRADLPADNVLPPVTAYHVMRIGQLPRLPFYRPGDPALAAAVGASASLHHAMLLANHGPVVAGRTLAEAVYNAEELEESAKIFLLLEGWATRYLTPEQVAEVSAAFPS